MSLHAQPLAPIPALTARIARTSFPKGTLARRLRDALESYVRSCCDSRTAARVSEFAQRLGRSRPYVSRLYLRVFGKPVRELMRELQVRRAEQLLRSGRRSTSEIASMAGFGTQMTFFRVFFALRGMKPNEFRQKVTK